MNERDDKEFDIHPDDPAGGEELAGEVWSGETLPLAGGPIENDGEAESTKTAAGGNASDPLPDQTPHAKAGAHDARLYFKYGEGWAAHFKHDWMKEYCYAQNPGEDYYHLLLSGEIYVQRGTEKYCLNCALRHGHITHDRLFWQRDGARPSDETK
jgi:hypothetical protein